MRSARRRGGLQRRRDPQFGDALNYMIKVRAGRGRARLRRTLTASASQHRERRSSSEFGGGNTVTVEQAARSSAARRLASSRRRRSPPSCISFVVTLIYLAIRFEWRFGVAASIATAHDIAHDDGVPRHDAPRGLAHRRRGDPDRDRLLAQRHDHHLRSRARESEESSARSRCATCSIDRSTRRCRARC